MRFWKNSGAGWNSPWLWGTLVGVLFLVLGAFGGELVVIWRKAVMICMECIGIG